MVTWNVQATARAPLAAAFDVFANPERIPDVHPDRRVTFHGDTRRGVGTQFTAHRTMKGKSYDTPLEIVDHDAPTMVRTVADQGGSIWDTTMTFSETDGVVTVQAVMEGRPHKVMPRLMMPLVKGMIRKGMQSDLDDACRYAEGEAQRQP